MQRFSCPQDAFDWFLTFHNAERTPAQLAFRLDRIKAMLAEFGSPHVSCPVYHVAGSKGKGSVTSMISSILTEAGHLTGRYLSPHVMDYRERITMNGEFFPDATYIAAGEAIRSWFGENGARFIAEYGEPTFFELTTLYAFLIFKAEGCERLALETGLGGRLDATNASEPRACILTPIELEHTEYLGDTLEKIAAEKAGIIKPFRPVFSSAQPPSVERLFRERASALHSPIHFLPDTLGKRSESVSSSGTVIEAAFNDASLFPHPFSASIRLIGRVQADNALLAALAVMASEEGIGQETIARGLSKTVIPARFEIMRENIVIDGAHTPSSIRLTMETFRKIHPAGGTLLFACAADKDVETMTQILAREFDSIVVTRPGTFKASDTGKIDSAFRKAGKIPVVVVDTAEATRKAMAGARPLLVTGSFYLCAIAREIIMDGRLP